MEVPKIYTIKNKEYFLVKQYKDYARYQTARGVCECFSFHELGMIEEMIEPPQRYCNPELVRT